MTKTDEEQIEFFNYEGKLFNIKEIMGVFNKDENGNNIVPER